MEKKEFERIRDVIIMNFGDAPYDRIIALLHKLELEFKMKFRIL